jgi:hypothetical protein
MNPLAFDRLKTSQSNNFYYLFLHIHKFSYFNRKINFLLFFPFPLLHTPLILQRLLIIFIYKTVLHPNIVKSNKKNFYNNNSNLNLTNPRLNTKFFDQIVILIFNITKIRPVPAIFVNILSPLYNLFIISLHRFVYLLFRLLLIL